MKHVGGVAFGLNLVPNFRHASVAPNQKCGPDDAEERFPEELLHPARAISLNGREFRIAQKREIELIFRRELRLRIHAVRAAAQDDSVSLIEIRFCVAKLGRFVDSTRGESLRKEVEHHRFSREV